MRKKTIIILAVILSPVLVFLAANIDTGPVEGEFTLKDMKPATVEKDNGFYRLLTLIEPPETDIESQEILEKYRDMYAPEEHAHQDSGTWGRPGFYQKWGRSYLANRGKARQTTIYMKRLSHFSYLLTRDVVTDLIKDIPRIEKRIPQYDYLLKRYEKVLNSPKIEVFMKPTLNVAGFQQFIILRTAGFFTVVKIIEALKGDWTPAVKGLLRQLTFAKRLIRGSRFISINIMGKTIMRRSLRALCGLMNQKECPKEIYALISRSMPPLKPEEYQLGNALIGSYLYAASEMDYPGHRLYKALKFFSFQQNRTRNYFLQYLNRLLKYEKKPVHEWDVELRELRWKRLAKGTFWWFRNGAGKWYTDSWLLYAYRALPHVYRSKTYYDLTRLAAQLHQAYTPDKPVKHILEGLEAYKELDPCSGKPYKWNGRKSLLYGVAMDKKDNDGGFFNYRITGNDYAVICKLKRK